MHLPSFGIVSRYREAQRLRQVVNTFLSYGFETFLATRFPFLLLRRVFKKKEPEEPPQVRFRKALESLGPTFIKLGQILSTRPDILPESWIEELMKLRDELPPVSWDRVEVILEEELGKSWMDNFDFVDKRPIGSASIAQVYRARLKTGEDVVIKVRRPGIEEVVELDLAVIMRIANLMHRHVPELRIYDLPKLVDEFAFTIKREMDFRVEAANSERIREFFKNGDVKVPKVYWHYTTKRVLVMEFVPGEKLEHWEADEEDRCRVAKTISIAFIRQVLELGIFHADPHPANIIVGEDDVCLVDFGMVGYLDREMREFATVVFVSVVKRDYDTLVSWYKRMGLVERIDERRFKLELMGLVEPYLYQSLERINIGEVVYKIVEISVRYGVRFPTEFLMLGRAMLVIDGTVKVICSRASVLEIVAPYAQGLLKRRVKLEALAEGLGRVQKEVLQVKDNLVLLSSLAAESALRAREEGIRVRVLQDEIRDRELRKLGNRLVASTIGVGLFLASLFSWAFKIGWWGKAPLVPFLCLLGCLVLLAMAFFTL